MPEKINLTKLDIRIRVYNFYHEMKTKYEDAKLMTYYHFKMEDIPKTTIYRIMRQCDNQIGPLRKQGSGRIAKIMTRKNIKRLQDKFDHHSGILQRKAAKEFKCSPMLVNKTLKNKTNIRCYNKIKIPKRSDQQKKKIRPLCRKLYMNFKKFDFIMDDESYFTLSNSNLLGNDTFYSSDVPITPADVKFKTKSKYESKILVWLAISPKGMSRAYIASSGLAINTNIYVNKCLRLRLLPFINQHYKDGQYIFWPDKASCHYSEGTINFLREKNINFVDKEMNPPNIPEARPIEDFWKELKDAVYEKGWEASNIKELRSRINYCMKKVDIKHVQQLALSTIKRLDLIRRNDIIENRNF